MIVGLSMAQVVRTFSAENQLQLIETHKIWDRGQHNAFTDLIRFQDHWFCAFREGQGHVSPDGSLRIITSSDGIQWKSASLIRSTDADLRDPKLSVTPDGRLLVTAVAAWHKPHPATHKTMIWHSDDGHTWDHPVEIGDDNIWLWRTVWHEKTAYNVGYSVSEDRFTRLYRSTDGRTFAPLVDRLFDQGYSNETALTFAADGQAFCLLRRDGEGGSAQLGFAKPPYTNWKWRDLGVKIGGPQMIRLPDGRHLAAVRLYDGGARTSLCWVDSKDAQLTECLRLPSGGDTSYAGLVMHGGLLWVSYYSSHEGKTSIYLSKVRIAD